MTPTLRYTLAAALFAACSARPQTVIVVSAGSELVCTARGGSDRRNLPAVTADASTAVPDVTSPPTLDAAAVVAVDAGTAATPDSPPMDPSRLALLPAERSWSVGRLARCEGARAVVLLRDGTVVTRPVGSLRSVRLRAGAEVMALWGDAPGEPYHAVVLDSNDEGVNVRYDDGSEERTAFTRIDQVLRGAETASAAGVCPPRAGTLPAVMVVRETWRRAAEVIECGGPSVLVETRRDGRTTVPAAGLSRADFARGDRLMVRWRDGTDYAARIDRVEGANLAITYDEGSEESVHVGQVVSWAPPVGATRSANPYSCVGATASRRRGTSN